MHGHKVGDVVDPGLEDDPDPLLLGVVGPDLLSSVLGQPLAPPARHLEDAGLGLGQEPGPPLVTAVEAGINTTGVDILQQCFKMSCPETAEDTKYVFRK